jgi:hypothetical protein
LLGGESVVIEAYLDGIEREHADVLYDASD